MQLHAEAADEHRRSRRMLARRGSDSTLRQAELGAGHEGLVGRFVIAGVLEALGQVCVQPLQRPQQLLLAEVAA